ncbi:[Skp1-protein]-hydroxyproline N-acetylglucosaminyltransferase, family GT60 [Ectocarpus siliculosus]|uniref:procollagen-lysine 5-dioxygenase n=1 Tax=Ectocarpus siliculosus TaxID=2880 RepID=D7FNT7_ECTSI|nr:[Skp1-protein]-hydroxyproline N-acetylglucosaminyltransferase, family GT60 [Ectocarpus siliculosus]|eukprot:CBJ30213.1 [Skp1-protein]-hydroxyproline N-acetylglucosaminyltransferase, family GT60 [Ectocarpus siliculosus]
MALPAKVQASIMSWLDESSTAIASGQSEPAAAEDDYSYPVITPADLFSLSSGGFAAGSPGVVVKDGFLGREQALQAHAAALEVENRGEMKPAGMGRRDGVWHGQQSRGDSIMWITEGIRGKGELPEGLENLLMRLSALRGPLNDGCGLPTTSSAPGLGLVKDTTSVQLARYPGDGRGYVRHRDTPRSAQDSEEAERKITALYYLNPDWRPSMGGQLRVHLDSRPEAAAEEGGPRPAGEEEEKAGRKWDIEPVLDRLVLFRSDLVEHEVLPASAPRLAVTLWFYGRQLGLPASPSTRSPSSVPPLPAPEQQLAAGDDTRDKVRPLPSPAGSGAAHAAEASIFVSVVSYRDSEANPTVVDLFARATNPERVSVGLVWQLEAGVAEDEAMHRATPGGKEIRGGRVRSLFMPAADAAGPSWARRVAQSIWKGEKYVLQIDSHTRFRPGWDSYLIHTLQSCPSFKPILTTYPVGYQLPHKIPAGETRPTLLVPDGFGPDGMLRQTGRLLLRKARDPLPSPLWASGFSFSASAVLVEVPYDPGLRHSFFGEEASMAARMFTRGWDFFAPPQAVVYHLWTRGHRASFRQNSTKEAEAEEAAANRRLRWLLGGGGTTSSSSPPGNGNGGEGEGSTDGDHGGAAEGGFSEGKEEEGQEAWGQQGSGEDEQHCYFARPGYICRGGGSWSPEEVSERYTPSY